MRSLLVVISIFFPASVPLKAQKTRLVILADMGNEPDEEQQMMHLLMYANEVELEGLIAVTGIFLNPNSKRPDKRRLFPELFHHLIEGYAKVVDNLQKHASGWPTPAYLDSIVKTGQSDYGMSGVGAGKASEGSTWLKQLMRKEDARPIYVVVNAGSNTLAQALMELQQEEEQAAFDRLLGKLRVFENGAQDDAGAWICHHFPGIHWIRSKYQTYCYGGPGADGSKNNKGDPRHLGPHNWQPYAYNGIGQHQWLLEHVIGNHGPFGPYYPLRQFPRGGIAFMEGGGTTPWLGLVRPGLSSIDHPHWGGWQGRHTADKVQNEWSKHARVEQEEKTSAPFAMYIDAPDTWTDPVANEGYDNIFTPVFRWREAFYNDFRGRMDWCRSDYDQANHNPVAAIGTDQSDEILFRRVKAGTKLSFDARASSDPDGDSLRYHWWIYPEAGTYQGQLELPVQDSPTCEVKIPTAAKGTQIHLILEIHDLHPEVELFDYRRVVIDVD
ncbi:MAG: nucleoside hydrolase-like domain-containing protein [Bacteroidota bacterium]